MKWGEAETSRIAPPQATHYFLKQTSKLVTQAPNFNQAVLHINRCIHMRITHPATGRNRSLQIQSNDLDRASRAAKDRDAAPLTRDELHELGAALDEFGLVVPAEEVLVGPTHSRGFRRISMVGPD